MSKGCPRSYKYIADEEEYLGVKNKNDVSVFPYDIYKNEVISLETWDSTYPKSRGYYTYNVDVLKHKPYFSRFGYSTDFSHYSSGSWTSGRVHSSSKFCDLSTEPKGVAPLDLYSLSYTPTHIKNRRNT